jgi:hypothetical protein
VEPGEFEVSRCFKTGYIFHDISLIANFVVARIRGRPYDQTVESQFSSMPSRHVSSI